LFVRCSEVASTTMECYMRIAFLTTLTVATVGLVDSRPASANYTCVGAEYVCGSPRAAAAAKSARPARAAKAPRVSFAYDQPAKPRRAGSVRREVVSGAVGGSSHQSGVASYYWQPQRVASGGWFNPNAMTAAHKTLPFGTKVRVTHAGTGRSVLVTINDRGPYVAGRVIDLSRAAASSLGMAGAGVARVNLAVVSR
jgi:rare lipoprotein A